MVIKEALSSEARHIWVKASRWSTCPTKQLKEFVPERLKEGSGCFVIEILGVGERKKKHRRFYRMNKQRNQTVGWGGDEGWHKWGVLYQLVSQMHLLNATTSVSLQMLCLLGLALEGKKVKQDLGHYRAFITSLLLILPLGNYNTWKNLIKEFDPSVVKE